MEMSNELLGMIMLVFLLGVIFVGFPISFTLIFVALIFGYWAFGNMVFHLVAARPSVSCRKRCSPRFPCSSSWGT